MSRYYGDRGVLTGIDLLVDGTSVTGLIGENGAGKSTLLRRRDADRPVGELPGGQQRRLALALISARPPHVFLLDEPTNHLSLTLANELEDALGTYPGAVVVATHDRWLLRRFDRDELRMAAGDSELRR